VINEFVEMERYYFVLGVIFGTCQRQVRRKGATKAVGHSVRKCFFFTIPLQYMLLTWQAKYPAKQQTDSVTFKINLYFLVLLGIAHQVLILDEQ